MNCNSLNPSCGVHVKWLQPTAYVPSGINPQPVHWVLGGMYGWRVLSCDANNWVRALTTPTYPPWVTLPLQTPSTHHNSDCFPLTRFPHPHVPCPVPLPPSPLLRHVVVLPPTPHPHLPLTPTHQITPLTLPPPCHDRGFQPTGRLAYILERCIADVLKFVSLFILWDMGFALAFYTMQVRLPANQIGFGFGGRKGEGERGEADAYRSEGGLGMLPTLGRG